jgi:hypothetical protein
VREGRAAQFRQLVQRKISQVGYYRLYGLLLCNHGYLRVICSGKGETAFVAGFRSTPDGRGLRGIMPPPARRMHFATPEGCVAELVDLATTKDVLGRTRTDCRGSAALARPNRNIESWRLSCVSCEMRPQEERERCRMVPVRSAGAAELAHGPPSRVGSCSPSYRLSAMAIMARILRQEIRIGLPRQ